MKFSLQCVLTSAYLLRIGRVSTLFWKNLYFISPLIWHIKFDMTVLMQRVKLEISMF